MKKNVLLTIVLSSIIIVSGCTQVDKKTEKSPIKIVLNAWPGYAHVFIAQEKGFFKRHNVEVELIFTKEYPEAQKIFRNGDADGIAEVYTDTIFRNANDIPSKVIYVVDYSDTADVIIGKSDTLASLKGKTVGIERINSFSHIFVLRALENVGLYEGDVQFEIVPAPKVLDALEEGRIDAGHTWEPTKSAALKKGYTILATAGDVPGIITDVISLRSELIKERPKAVQSIFNALVEAQEYRDANWEEAIQIMAKAEGMSTEEMDSGLKEIKRLNLADNLKAMQKSENTTSLYGAGKIIADFYLDRGQINQVPNLDEIIEPRFANHLARNR